MNTHTWKVGEPFDTDAHPLRRVISISVAGRVVAHVNCGYGTEQAKSDARLIAAAIAVLATR